jgi:hypothetical protein
VDGNSGTGVCNIGNTQGVAGCQRICASISGCKFFSTSTTMYCYACFVWKTCPNQKTVNSGSYQLYQLEPRCYQPVCGANGFCVGYESDGNVYCYGASSGCLWGSTDCRTDLDCQKYAPNSQSTQKYTDGGLPSCAAVTGWPRDACTCVSVVCSSYISLTITVFESDLCVNTATGGQVIYYGRMCSPGLVEWTGAQTVANSIRPGLTAAECSWTWSGNARYSGFCGVAPTISYGNLLPTTCTQTTTTATFTTSTTTSTTTTISTTKTATTTTTTTTVFIVEGQPSTYQVIPGDSAMTGPNINSGNPITIKFTLDLGNNIWIVGLVDNPYLKMSKIEITATNTYRWISTFYDASYSQACATQAAFTEQCFKGTAQPSDVYPLRLRTSQAR